MKEIQIAFIKIKYLIYLLIVFIHNCVLYIS